MVNKSPRTTVLNTTVILTKDIPQPVINFQEVGDGTEVADEIIKTKKRFKKSYHSYTSSISISISRQVLINVTTNKD